MPWAAEPQWLVIMMSECSESRSREHVTLGPCFWVSADIAMGTLLLIQLRNGVLRDDVRRHQVATCASMRRPHLPHLRQPPALTAIETQSLPGDAP
jgi:hypothetical protein